MTQVRPKRQRRVEFRALEGRLALNPRHGRRLSSRPRIGCASSQRSIIASFRGHVSISGSTVSFNDLTGKVAKIQFTGYGSGAVAGKLFQGGDVYLSNSQGNIHLPSGRLRRSEPGSRQSRWSRSQLWPPTVRRFVRSRHGNLDEMEYSRQSQKDCDIFRTLERLGTGSGG